MKIIIISFILFFNLYARDYKSLLFHGNCTTCHFKVKNVSAPSIINLKKRYKSAFPQKKDFINYMATWVEHPDKKTSLMDDAIQEYELMPELGFDLDTLKQISEYIYDTDFTKSDDF